MSSARLHLDTAAIGNSQQVLPEAPLLASDLSSWPNILAELHRQPPHHTPRYSTGYTTLCIHTGEALDVEWWFEEKYSKSTVSYNQMTLYPAQIERSIRWQDEKNFLLLSFQDNFVDDILGEDGAFTMPELVPQLGVYDPFIREIGQLFRQQLEQKNTAYSLYIESLSLVLGVYLTQHYSTSQYSIRVADHGLSTNQVRQIQDYVEAHLSEQIRLKDLSKLLEMSPFHFSRQFKQATFMAPYQFVMRARINRAKVLLRSRQSLNISDIAFRCGFSSQSHFAYHFRKAEGISPKTYRQDFN